MRSWSIFKGLLQVGALAWLTTEATSGPASKPALIFDLDQAFKFGVVETLDLVGLDRMLEALKQFRSRYEAYALFTPLTARTDNFERVLQETAARGVPFYLDVFSSDAMALGNIATPARADADPVHAQTIWLESLQRLKADPQIGPFLKGLRFHEYFAIDFTVKACLERRAGRPRIDWCDPFARNATDPGVFDIERAKPFLDFARRENMTVFWSDWKWDAATAAQQKQLRALLASGDYRDTIVLAYANNLPDEAARDDDADWRRWLETYQPLVGTQIRGLALSDQSWTCVAERACPTDVVVAWAQRGLRAGADAVEFEPAFHFFDLPDREDKSYPGGDVWRRRSGTPRASLAALARTLDVNFPSLAAKRIESETSPDAECVALTAGTTRPHKGDTIRVTATFRNIGTQTWPPATQMRVEYDANLIATADSQPRLSAISPNDTKSVSFNSYILGELKNTRMTVSLVSTDGQSFGQPCSLLLTTRN